MAHPLNLPRYDGASERLRHALHVVGQCCLNETTASAFLERCLKAAMPPMVRATLRELLADEVDHARLGWAHLASPSLSTETRQAIAAWLPRMIATSERTWRHRPELPVAPVYAEHGLPPLALVEEAVSTAMVELIIPACATSASPPSPTKDRADHACGSPQVLRERLEEPTSAIRFRRFRQWPLPS